MENTQQTLTPEELADRKKNSEEFMTSLVHEARELYEHAHTQSSISRPSWQDLTISERAAYMNVVAVLHSSNATIMGMNNIASQMIQHLMNALNEINNNLVSVTPIVKVAKRSPREKKKSE